MFFRRKAAAPPGLTLEGALGPNDRLDQAPAMAVADPAAICVLDGALLVASGNRVLRLPGWAAVPEVWRVFDAPVTALAVSAGGRVAVGLGDRLAVVDGDGPPMLWPAGQIGRISDLGFAGEDAVALADPGYAPDQPLLTLAPWDEVARGQLVMVRAGGEVRQIAGGLHAPMGVVAGGAGFLLTELDRARIVDEGGRVRQAGFPAYLGRLRKISTGYALACLSRRDPLIEFLRTEPDFVRRMKQAVHPDHWIAPRARPDFAHDLPITLGATRLHGAIKPWAPSFSYGLVILLDDALMPTGSAHSRANGRRHAIADVCEWNGSLIALSLASGEILNLGAA